MTDIDHRAATDAEGAQNMMDAAGKYMERYTNQADHFGLPDAAAKLLMGARQNVNGAFHEIVDGRDKADRIMADDTIYPDGRERIAGEAAQQARTSSTDQLDNADSLLDAAEKVLIHESAPKVARPDALIARDDARMILGAIDNPEDVGIKAMELARRQDDIGGLLASDWGHNYLSSRGVSDVDSVHDAVKRSAVEAAVSQSTDTARQRAAKNVSSLANLRKAITSARHAQGMAFNRW